VEVPICAAASLASSPFNDIPMVETPGRMRPDPMITSIPRKTVMTASVTRPTKLAVPMMAHTKAEDGLFLVNVPEFAILK